jgi:predicted DCC family thiol-disulfide oxidoreductase YuxK
MADAFDRESDLPFKLPSHLELHKEIHLYSSEGQLWKGADAIAQLAALFPRSKWLGKMIMWPGIRQVARWVYGKIAENRHRLFRSFPAK